MVYKFRKGSYIKADAQAAGEMCEQLEARGKLTAEELLNANRAEDAPLHDSFEWDDSVAAESWRMQQARHIINSLEIVTENREPVRAFFSIVRSEPNYRHIDTILQRQDDTEALLKMALSELQAFQKKYSQLVELAAVFSAIDSIAKRSA